MKDEIKLLIGGLAIVGLGLLESMTGALSSLGKGVAGLGTGIQTGVSAFLSPQITPRFAPSLELGLNLCIPMIGLPCTVTSREKGGSGSGVGNGSASQRFITRAEFEAYGENYKRALLAAGYRII